MTTYLIATLWVACTCFLAGCTVCALADSGRQTTSNWIRIATMLIFSPIAMVVVCYETWKLNGGVMKTWKKFALGYCISCWAAALFYFADQTAGTTRDAVCNAAVIIAAPVTVPIGVAIAVIVSGAWTTPQSGN